MCEDCIDDDHCDCGCDIVEMIVLEVVVCCEDDNDLECSGSHNGDAGYGNDW